MIDSTTKRGKLQWDQMGYQDSADDLLKVFTEDPSDKGRYRQAIVIQLKEEIGEGKLKYIGTKVKEYDSRDIYRYMYKQGSPNGSDLSPTAKITKPERTLRNKILKRIQEVADYCQIENMNEESRLVHEMVNVIEKEYDHILQDLEQIYKNRDRNILCFLTVSAIKDEKEFLPGDIPVFQKAFVNDSLRGFYYRTTGNIDTRIESGVCSMCHQTDIETYGFASPFSFYTIDKPGYISGGFQKSMIPYNYPVCRMCSIWLLLGKKYLDEHLTFNAFGKSLYIIPKTKNTSSLSRVLNNLKKLNHAETFNEFQEIYLDREDKLFKYLSQIDEDCTFNIVFFKEDNRAFRILLDLNDVLPSRLKTIFQMMKNIISTDFFRQFPVSGKREMHIWFNFNWLRDILESSGNDRYFMEAFGSIITNKKIDYHFLLKFVMQELINAFNETGKKDYKLFTISSYGFLLFLHNLNLLNYYRKGGDYMNIPDRNVYDIKDYSSRKDMFEAFFHDHRSFFDKPEKKAAFMIGYLTQNLLNIQMKKYDNNTPFRARLKGLKLTEKDIRRLYYEISNKLGEYEIHYLKPEEGLCAGYFIRTDGKWRMLNEEISFFVALGMNMTHCFRFQKNHKETEGDE